MVRSYLGGPDESVSMHHKELAMSDFGKEHGLIHEAIVTGRKVGATEKLWAALAHGEELFARVVAFVTTALTPLFRLVAGFDRDMAKEDKWEPILDDEPKEGGFQPELVSFLKDGEDYVLGDEMVKRTEQEIIGGQRAAEAMLRDQDKIPEEWRKYVLVFPRTVWRSCGGYRHVAYLYWGGERCFLSSTGWATTSVGSTGSSASASIKNSPLSLGIFALVLDSLNFGLKPRFANAKWG